VSQAVSFDLKPGIELTVERVVDDSLVTRHVGGRGLFATPAMIGLMEVTSNKLVMPQLPAGFTSVGYEVCVRHLAPAGEGDAVVVTSVLKEVVGNRLLFEVACLKDGATIGSGTHRRAVVQARS
jgi:predicted thioesterase